MDRLARIARGARGTRGGFARGITVAESDAQERAERAAARFDAAAPWPQTCHVRTPDSHHALSPLRQAQDDPFDPAAEARDEPRRPEARVAEDDPRDYYARHVAGPATDEACAALAREPQTSPAWLAARRALFTASQFGKLAFGSEDARRAVYADKLWDLFHGNEMTHWGRTMEPRACEAYEAWARAELADAYVAAGRDPAAARLRVEHLGLCRFAEEPWLGVSPDGIVHWTDPDGTPRRRLVEFKCPYNLWRDTGTHPYARRGPENTPADYYAQMQGILGLFADQETRARLRQGLAPLPPMDTADFVVWTPRRLWITRHARDAAYWEHHLRPALRRAYFEEFLPLLWQKARGTLRGGTTLEEDLIELGDEDLVLPPIGMSSAAAVPPRRRKRLRGE